MMMIVVNTNMVARYTPKAASKRAGLKEGLLGNIILEIEILIGN